MAQVTIKLVDALRIAEFYFDKNAGKLAQKLYAEGFYSTGSTFDVEQVGEDAANEAFDRTNNPRRWNEHKWQHRSVSVGDIVIVGTVPYLCKSFGWEQIQL